MICLEFNGLLLNKCMIPDESSQNSLNIPVFKNAVEIIKNNCQNTNMIDLIREKHSQGCDIHIIASETKKTVETCLKTWNIDTLFNDIHIMKGDKSQKLKDLYNSKVSNPCELYQRDPN